MTEQEKQELKTFAWAAPLITPMLERRKRIAFGLLMQSFKAGKTDNITLVAELNVLSDLESEITQKLNEFRSMEEAHVTDRK
jgi:hypothetical protein